MRKYQTDGGLLVDFYSEIDNIDLNEEENICLISNLPLDENHITLKCGHKFNYRPIYNDVINVKSNHRMLVKRIEIDQLQCPYCRNIQRCLLPYIPKLRLPKKDGVNWINASKYFPHRVYSKMGDCSVVSCEKNVQTIWDDDKVKEPFCFMHYNKKYPRTCKNRKVLGEKIQEKPLSSINNNTQNDSLLIDISDTALNEVISVSQIENNNHNEIENNTKNNTSTSPKNTCSIILKSGMRKGEECGAKIKINGVCLRHKNYSIKQ